MDAMHEERVILGLITFMSKHIFLRAEFILPNAFFSHGWQEQLTAN